MVVNTRGSANANAQRGPANPARSRASSMTAGPAVLPQAQSAPSQASHAELEQEPDAAATDSDDKSATKIDLKNIKVTPFDGTVKEGSFDAKAREFREELDEQINDAQVLAGQTWTDAVRKVAFKIS